MRHAEFRERAITELRRILPDVSIRDPGDFVNTFHIPYAELATFSLEKARELTPDQIREWKTPFALTRDQILARNLRAYDIEVLISMDPNSLGAIITTISREKPSETHALNSTFFTNVPKE